MATKAKGKKNGVLLCTSCMSCPRQSQFGHAVVTCRKTVVTHLPNKHSVCLYWSAGDVISALKAFETTLRAICRHSSVPVYRPLLDQLQQHQDQSQPLTAVSASTSRCSHSMSCCTLHGLIAFLGCLQVVVSASTHPEVVAAVADCLASYPATKSLSYLGCCVGDKVRNVL
jgi:hypothetical protein